MKERMGNPHVATWRRMVVPEFHWGNLNAEPIELTDLIIEDRTAEVSEAIEHATVVRDLAVAPTLPDLTRKFSHPKTPRGLGENGLAMKRSNCYQPRWQGCGAHFM